MRRPSPLPPSPATVARQPAAVAAPEASAAPAASDPLEHDDETSTAPVIPLAAPPALPDSSALAAGDDQTTDEKADAAGAAVGWRTVWRAARARRKALRAEVRRFTVRQRRRRAVWLGVAASVVVLVLGTLGAAYSPLFAVEKISIVGTSQLDAATVEAALGDQVGTPLPLVDESAIKAALVTFPLVESYALEARPPHELVVRIVERTPVGVIQTGAGFSVVDAAGVVLSTAAEPAAGMALLDVRGGTGSAAFAAVGQVMRSLPDAVLAQVTAVTATSPDDVTLMLGGANAQVVWGSAERSAEKAQRLETIMRVRPPESVYSYDVSSPDAIAVR